MGMETATIKIGDTVLNEQWFYTLIKSTLGKVIEINESKQTAKIEVLKCYDFKTNCHVITRKTTICKIKNLKIADKISY